MNNFDEATDSVSLPKKNVWRVVAILALLVIVFGGLLFWYLSNKPKSEKSTSLKMCSGVDIVFFSGGNEKDSFASVVAGGARAAEADLGANVEYVWSGWNTDTMVNQFIDSVAKNPDAIAIMGHPGAKALSPLIDQAERENIIVTSQNVDLPEIRAKYSSNGFGYVGQAVYESGLLVADAVVRKFNLKEGDEAIIFGVDPYSNPSRYERTKGGIDGLKNGKLTVYEITMPNAVQDDATSEAALEMISNALATHPNVKAIITDHGPLTASITDHLKKLNKKPGEIIVAGFDLSSGTVVGIKENYVGLVLDQQPYLQGYLPILQACLTKKFGFAGLYINTGMGLIDSSNVDLVSGLADQKIR